MDSFSPQSVFSSAAPDVNHCLTNFQEFLMGSLDTRSLGERGICAALITPAGEQWGEFRTHGYFTWFVYADFIDV